MIRIARTMLLVGISAVLLACQGQSAPSDTSAAAVSSPTAAAAGLQSQQPSGADGTCRGPEVDWSALPPVARAYGKAWNERDPATRLQLVEQALTDSGAYADPTMDGPRVTGHEAIADMIGQFLNGEDGNYFQPTEWIASDQHHGYLQMRWQFCSADGEVLLEGVDFGEPGPDGRIQRVTGFHPLEVEAPRAVCAPPAGDWTGIPEIARKWAASTDSDPATRNQLLREVFAEGGSYVDPSDVQRIVGYEALDERVAGMLWDGAFFEAAAWGDGDSHHDYLRLRWRLCDKDVPALEGTDYVELDAAGKFVRVVGFFPWP